MVLGVELLVIFSCASFPSLLVIPFDREDWYDWSPQAMPFTPVSVFVGELRQQGGIKTMQTFLVHLGII